MEEVKVLVPLAELKRVMRAAKRCLSYLSMADIFESGGLACDTEDMVEAFKRIKLLVEIAEIKKKHK